MVYTPLSLIFVCLLRLVTVTGLEEAKPGLLMDLLDKPTANRTLIIATVECLEDPTGKKNLVTFLRCVNDHLHVHQRTKFDSVGFILGNYVIRAATKFVLSEEESIIDRTKAFGDCAPMLLRNLFGMKEFSFSCRKRSYIEGYDESDDDDFDEGETDIE